MGEYKIITGTKEEVEKQTKEHSINGWCVMGDLQVTYGRGELVFSLLITKFKQTR